MKLLYSNILPLGTKEHQQTIKDCFEEQFQQSDEINIAVGYVSNASLEELNMLVSKYNIKKIVLNIGMYFIDGMPEKIYHTALHINQKWHINNIGEIRVIKPFKYHGKIYCFYKNGKPFSAIIGSANLSVIKLEATNRRQYEIASLITEQDKLSELTTHLQELNTDKCSSIISDIKNMPLLREINTALSGIELVSQIPPANVKFYEQCKEQVSFCLPLKVPKFNERHMDDNKHYTKSNINVCYAAPRNKRKSRDWFETQLTVSKNITKMDGYPEKNKPFFIVTDDGYGFKAHTTSDGNKQFSAVGDELILGRWIKGRLAAAGLVNPVNDTKLDVERMGMITQEMLDEYGCNHLNLKKTGQMIIDNNGLQMDVWLLSFESNNT